MINSEILSLVTKKDENVNVVERGNILFIMNFSDEEKEIEISNETVIKENIK